MQTAHGERVTTKEPTTTAEPTTTVPPTTEEPTTPEETTTKKVSVDDYEFKGMKLTVSKDKKDFFVDMVIENGTKIYLNDIYGGTTMEEDVYRGSTGTRIADAIWATYEPEKVDEFYESYIEPGLDVSEITFDKNAVIEYNGEHRWYFYYVGENNKGRAVFDIYEIE